MEDVTHDGIDLEDIKDAVAEAIGDCDAIDADDLRVIAEALEAYLRDE
jgi:hypothetical protein